MGLRFGHERPRSSSRPEQESRARRPKGYTALDYRTRGRNCPTGILGRTLEWQQTNPESHVRVGQGIDLSSLGRLREYRGRVA